VVQLGGQGAIQRHSTCWLPLAEQKPDSRPDWTGMGQNGLQCSAHFSQVAFLVSSGPFLFKKVGKLRIVTSHGITFGADGCPFKHPRLALGEFSSQGTHA
jgi:hypothetical protein